MTMLIDPNAKPIKRLTARQENMRAVELQLGGTPHATEGERPVYAAGWNWKPASAISTITNVLIYEI